MVFFYENKKYFGQTAVNIVQALKSDSIDYQSENETIQDFLIWSLERMSDRIPQREIDISPRLSDETLAFNYLCLLDNYKIGRFYAGDLTLK